jgi:hypothetical protein
MIDFETFKQKRLRQDPTAGKYSDYEWDRAYKAYLSARGQASDTPSDSATPSRGRRRARSSGARGNGPSLAPLASGFRTVCVVALVSGFFVAVFLGWFISTMGGVAGLIGFLAGCALLAFFSALVAILYGVNGQLMNVHQSLERVLSASRAEETEGKRPSSESGS